VVVLDLLNVRILVNPSHRIGNWIMPRLDPHLPVAEQVLRVGLRLLWNNQIMLELVGKVVNAPVNEVHYWL